VGLRTLFTLDDVELDIVALLQGLVAVGLNGTKVGPPSRPTKPHSFALLNHFTCPVNCAFLVSYLHAPGGCYSSRTLRELPFEMRQVICARVAHTKRFILPENGCRNFSNQFKVSMIGVWSEGFGSARGRLSMTHDFRRGTRSGESKKWSIRMPRLCSKASRK
jgi:hypothetical protein